MCFLTLIFFFHSSLNLQLYLLIRKLVQKMNSNRFISRLMDQNLIHIIRISALTFISSIGTLDLIYNSMRFLGILKGFCRNFDTDYYIIMNILPRFCVHLFIKVKG